MYDNNDQNINMHFPWSDSPSPQSPNNQSDKYELGAILIISYTAYGFLKCAKRFEY